MELEESQLVSSIPCDQLLDVNEALENLSEDLPEEAKAAQVFGAPSYVINGELWWGQDRLEFVRRAKKLGFTLDEIASLLTLQDEGGSKAEVKKLTREKLIKIEHKISDLQRMRAMLRVLNKQCSGSGSIRNCPIIETLTSTNDPLA